MTFETFMGLDLALAGFILIGLDYLVHKQQGAYFVVGSLMMVAGILFIILTL